MIGLLLLWCCDRAVPAAVSPLASAGPAPDPFSGVVTEVIQVRGYTYTRVDPDGDAPEVWVASLASGPKVGTPAEVSPVGRVVDFHSKQLDRTFSELLFATVRPGETP